MSKKAKAKSTARTKSSKATKPTKGGPPDPRLHAFVRSLYEKPALLKKFNAGDKARQKVIDGANLSSAHKDLLKKGCVPDIIGAMAGAAPPMPNADAFNIMVNCCDVMKCDHPECHALTDATKARAPKAKTPKKK